MGRVYVGILGATGAIGECYRHLLHNHPYFEVKFLAASDKNIGVIVDGVELCSVKDFARAGQLGVKIIFSALDTTIAAGIEPEWAANFLVISSSGAFRQKGKLIIPEINGELVLGKKTGLFSKSNCTLQPIVLPLFWLQQWGIERVVATTFQAVSGAGKKGLGAMEILDNVIPYIAHEEEKIQEELGFFLHSTPLDITCCRVAVTDGHTVALTIDFTQKITAEIIEKRFQESTTFHLFQEKNRPQPLLDRLLGGGMTIGVGRVRQGGVKGGANTIQMVTLSHNRVRGSAGTGIKIAEIAYGFTKPGF